MISSADYWATVFVVVSFAAMVIATRRTQRQIQNDRRQTLHAATVRHLGDGDRVVVSVGCSTGLPYRVARGGRVWGCRDYTTLVALVGLLSSTNSTALDSRAERCGAVALHHPSLRVADERQTR